MRLVTSLLTLAAATAASPLLSQQDDSGRVWLNTLPSNVTFECRGRIPGYYADVESGCQMYHMCDPQSRRYSYLCPAYTEFSQFYMTCVQHDRVNCNMSESFFHMNEMIGQPRTRFHDLRQHDHSKKKDTEGSKATNQVDASEPAGHVLFEFETKMDVKLEKVQRSRQPERTREGATGQGDAVDSHRANERRLPATRAPPRVPQPHRLFKTLSPPRDSESTDRRSPSSPAHGSESASGARRVRPRVRFSAFAGNTATTPTPERTEEEAEEKEEAPSSEEVPPLPRNTYRTFGLPGSFSFGTLLMRDNKSDATSTPEPVAAAPWATAASPTSARTTDAPSTEGTTRATTTRDRSNAASPVFGTSSATTEAPKAENIVTTTSRPSNVRPRARITTATERDQTTVATARTSARSSTESTPTHSTTTPVNTPKPTTTSTTTPRPTTERTTATSPTTTRTTEKTTTSDRWSRRTTEATTTETTTRTTTTEPTTTTKRTTTASTTLPTRAASQSTSRTSPTPSPSTALPSSPPSSAGTRRPLHSAPSVPSLLGKELPPIEELEALRLSFTLDPPKLAVKADGPHEERNMKVRGELITGEMALRKLMVDQLKPVYFPNPSLPLNLLPPLLSEQAEEDGGQTTTLTLPVRRRQRPDALLQAAAVAFNILPPELASLVPPLLTPPPPPLPSTGATAATSTAASESHHDHENPTKDRSNLTMKFGKKKTRFRDDDSHVSPNDACYPCMKSFVKDLDRCHPCVIIR